jgi:hypothetical protein
MDRLPHEVLEEVAALACVDGGAAGCALAGVSRAMRQASARARYHSVALKGPRQIRAFIALIRWSHEPSAPRTFWRRGCALPRPDVCVRHLFLADCDMRPEDPDAALAWKQWQEHAGPWGSVDDALAWIDTQADVHWTTPLGDALRRLGSGGSAHRAWACNAALAEAAVSVVLAHLAPALTHLHISAWLPVSWALLPDVVFPALCELTSSMREVNWQGPPIDLAHVAPALRRMHVVGDFAYGHRRLFKATSHPRSLAHLRLSECGYTGLLLEALSVPAESALCSPEHMERIVIALHAPHTARAAIMRSPEPTLRYPHSRYRYMVNGGCTHGQDIEPDERWDYGAWRREASRHSNFIIPKVSLVREVSLWTEARLYDDWLDAVQDRSSVWEEGVPLAVGE